MQPIMNHGITQVYLALMANLFREEKAGQNCSSNMHASNVFASLKVHLDQIMTPSR